VNSSRKTNTRSNFDTAKMARIARGDLANRRPNSGTGSMPSKLENPGGGKRHSSDMKSARAYKPSKRGWGKNTAERRKGAFILPAKDTC